MISSFIFVSPLITEGSSEKNLNLNVPSIETWKLKYIISDKVLDAVVVLARENRKIPSSYNNTDDCAREYVRQNLVFATWG
ncbi:MAG: hypothetical protein R2883_08255 [Caldisericia bacterium]